MCDEFDDAAAVAEIENGKVDRHRSGQHPEAICRCSKMRHIEGEHHEADDRIDDDRKVGRRNVSRDHDQRAVVGPEDLTAEPVHSASFIRR